MSKAVSRASFQRCSTTHFGTLLAEPIQLRHYPPIIVSDCWWEMGLPTSSFGTPGTSLPFNRLSRRKLSVRVRFAAWATCLQHTTVPGRNATHWTRDG